MYHVYFIAFSCIVVPSCTQISSMCVSIINVIVSTAPYIYPPHTCLYLYSHVDTEFLGKATYNHVVPATMTNRISLSPNVAMRPDE